MKPAKECVTTHLPNGLAPKMDGAEASDRYFTARARRGYKRVGGHMGCDKAKAQAVVEQLKVQILVVVANIQERHLKTEEEKGSM